MPYQYRSKYEERVAQFLTKHKVNFGYEEEKHLYRDKVFGGLCIACGMKPVYKERWYLTDFTLPNGIFIETKGRLTSSNRTSMLSLLDTGVYINRDNFRLLLMRDNKFGKAKNPKRYSDWCETNGIIYHVSEIGEVPLEWIN